MKLRAATLQLPASLHAANHAPIQSEKALNSRKARSCLRKAIAPSIGRSRHIACLALDPCFPLSEWRARIRIPPQRAVGLVGVCAVTQLTSQTAGLYRMETTASF
ncbi:hypothetical protein BDN71DRAFT_1092969 [Pleurotus eryngii]|uniref:Uncharacterized protein n=1 Tax=Pleurotus eryngii TaxID=5323 RepID=A0A9P6DER7_PLEER|nr:hypothetical protein BDN71DRAFT_1092969 [Pleurotus eryngii]